MADTPPAYGPDHGAAQRSLTTTPTAGAARVRSMGHFDVAMKCGWLISHSASVPSRTAWNICMLSGLNASAD
ncbi:hypothetical protein GCM10010201_13860 [Pilimelia columellifera subsp. columellifera]|uniref:Uncharacterized protein n=1 Tax=Pilimelia columellifera subsp. columellifera TaxID=706583 RepID=A0ABN3NB95_9ACTN